MNMNFLVKLAPKSYFKWHDTLFKITGLAPPDHKFFNKIFWICYVPHFICISLVLSTLEYIKIRQILVPDFKLAMFNLPTIALHLIVDIRIILWHFGGRKKYLEFVGLLDGKCDFSVFDVDDVEYMKSVQKKEYSYEKLKNVHSKFGGRMFGKKSEERKTIESYNAKKYTYANTFCYFYVSTLCYGLILIVSFIMISGWVEGPYEKFNPYVNRTSIYRKYGYAIHFPFDESISDGYYFWGVGIQIYLYISNVLAGLALDTLGVTCLIQAKVPLDVVKLALKNVDKNIKVENDEDRLKIIDIRIVKCIKEIQRCIRCAELIEDIFSNVFLIQYTVMTLILTSSFYTLLLCTDIMEAIAFLVQVVLMLFDPFCLCWYSQNFTEEFENLVPLIFEMNWVNYSPIVRKKLIFTMLRLKKPVGLTLGGFTSINLQFYILLLKNCYSILTLLTAHK